MTRSSIEYLSEDAFKQFKKELESLTKNKRKEIAKRLDSARSLGDLSENAEYQTAKEEQMSNESRILELEDILSRAVILSKNDKVRSKVELGCSVVLKKKSGDTVKYQIVGSEEADVFSQKISNESPLGKLLLGKEKGVAVEMVTPTGKVEYTVIEII